MQSAIRNDRHYTPRKALIIRLKSLDKEQIREYLRHTSQNQHAQAVVLSWGQQAVQVRNFMEGSWRILVL